MTGLPNEGSHGMFNSAPAEVAGANSDLGPEPQLTAVTPLHVDMHQRREASAR